MHDREKSLQNTDVSNTSGPVSGEVVGSAGIIATFKPVTR